MYARNAGPMALILSLLATAAPAAAQDGGPPAAPPQAPAPAPAPTPAPVKATIKLTLEHAGPRAHPGVLVGQRFRVRGTVTPYVPGQKVVVRFQRGRSKLRVVELRIAHVKGSKSGRFLVGLAPRSAGRVLVRASHRATPEMDTSVARPKSLAVVSPHARPGSRGPAVRLLQHQLRSLGYVTGRAGLYDARTARAVLAFRKLSGMARTTVASSDVFRRLARGGGRFSVRYPGHGHHVEADLTHQVLALIDGGRVRRIYPVSSGKPSTPTVLGSFRVYSKTPGTNSHGMVYSNYFIRGYAIHGYAEVPTYPASHGCLRVPIPDAVPIYRWVRYGDRVDVYYRSGRHRKPRVSAHAGP